MNYNPLRNETDPDSQKKKEIYRDLLQGICFYFIFACSFGANTSSPEFYGGKQCVVLLAWGRAAAFYLTMGFIIFCFVNPILTCTMPSIRNCFASAPEWIFQNILYYIRIFIYGWGGIIFLGLMVALGYNENCGDLASATGFFIFVVIVTLIIIGLCYCYVLKEDETIYQNVDENKSEQVQDYGTMQNDQQSQQQQQQQQSQEQIVDDRQQEPVIIDYDDPDQRQEKPSELMEMPK